MKKSLLIIALLFIIAGCQHKHNGKLVRDAEGNIYKLEGNLKVQENYRLIPIDTSEYKILRK